MRWTAWLGVALTGWLSAARAEEPPGQRTATITAPEAEVRAGAGDSNQLYPTNRLLRGERVTVVRELEGGWLAIKPPKGSFSWINSRFVRREGNTMTYVVVTDPNSKVPVLLGSNIRTDKPTVEGCKVMRGTLVRSIGAMRLADDGYWLPIEPPPAEVRYLRANDVAPKGSDVASGVPSPLAPQPLTPEVSGPPGFTPSTPPAAPPAAPAATNGPHPLWTRGLQEEQAGRYLEAVRLYKQLGAEVAASDHALSVQAFNRAQNLEDALNRRPPSRPLAGQPTSTTSRMTPQAQMATSPAGWLRRAGRTLDYSTLFVLEDSRGKPILYATAQQGYSLDVYANQNVVLIGPQQFRHDLRATHMTVMQIKPLR